MVMLGAIIGDIVGSRFEFNNHRSKDFDLFSDACHVTDDSIMSLAVAKAVMDADRFSMTDEGVNRYDEDYLRILSELSVKHMQSIGREYPYAGYGLRFREWVFSDVPSPYNSYGNGAAMRISAVGFAARTKKEAIDMSRAVTCFTHDHEEGIRGAEATAMAVYMAKQGIPKEHIRRTIVNEYYPMDFTIDGIRPTYEFNETCQDTVPQALQCFFESESFEDAIRIAISLGGDSDTIAAIAGAVAEAYYGIPTDIRESALDHPDSSLRAIYDDWVNFMSEASPRFESLTRFIEGMEATDSFGVWVDDERTDTSRENPPHVSFVRYGPIADSFHRCFYEFVEDHPEYQLNNYLALLDRFGIRSIENAEPEMLDAQGVLTLLFTAIRGERFCDGFYYARLEDGSVLKWLNRLEEIGLRLKT